MKKYVLLLLIMGLLFSWSCSDDNKDAVSMEFEETNCDNPWDAGPGSANYIKEVRTHIESNDITVYTIFIERFSEGEICQACNCLTGRKIVISIPESDEEKAESLGFTFQ